MNDLPRIHLCVQQPSGYIHSLGLLDQARYYRYQFRRLGAEVTVSKNRLRHDAVNVVFGAHLGFEPALRDQYACVFVNLEQLGGGGASVSADYLRLLSTSAVVDYDPSNRAAYAPHPDTVPIAPLLYAPYLAPAHRTALEQRPIDLLFIGSMNERRKAWLGRIEAVGLKVAHFDGPLYGIERDQFIVQAKAVVNAHFYESSRFEQARVAHCLSLGTPVISELTAQTRPHRAFDASVLWLQGSELEDFFTRDFATPAYFELMRAALERFTHADPINDYATVLAYATGFVRAHFERRSAAPWQPARINLGSGKDYKSGWLNLDVLERTEPDLVLDLSSALTLPLVIPSRTGATLRLEADSVDLIHANNVLEHVADLPALMGNCLRLLKLDGEFHIEVPYEHAATAWQDPTHVRAMNENSWIYYTDWFWYLGWFEHRYALKTSCYLNRDLAPCEREHAAFMRVVLRKVATTLRERMTARTLQADPGLPEDRVEPGQAFRWEPTDSRAQPLAA